MRRINEISIGLLAIVLAVEWTGSVKATTPDKLIADAKKEGVIDFYGSSTLTPQGAGLLEAAFNKKYGLNTKLTFHPSLNMTRMWENWRDDRHRGGSRMGHDGRDRCSRCDALAKKTC